MNLRNTIRFATVLLPGFAWNSLSENTITLSTDSAKSTIHREIYGALMENWGRDIYTGIYVGRNSPIPNTNGMRNDIIDGLKDCGITTLEFPGGCFADEYHWKDGIGTYSSRPSGEMTNGMGTDEYMELCKLIDAEPYICANLKTGTPDEMAEWINYINKNTSHPEWHVKYWSMGNEPWGCGGELSAKAFADQYKKFVAAVPVIDGKPLARIAGAGHWSPSWVDTVMGANQGKLEGFSVHKYLVNDWTDHAGPSFDYTPFQYHQITKLAYEVPSFIKSFDQAMNKYDPDKKIGLMYNEWGAWYTEIASQGYTFSQSTVRDALIAAIHLNSFNNNCERVHLACVAQPVNVIQSLFLTDKADQTKIVKTPVYYTFKLFKVHQKAKKIPITLQTASFNQKVDGTSFNYPYLTASASLDSANNVNITISNTDLTNVQDVNIQLNGSTTFSIVQGKIITAPEVTALNDFGKSEQVNIQTFANENYSLSGKTLNVKIPSKSVILLTLSNTTSINTPEPKNSSIARLSIKSNAEGKILIAHSFTSQQPITLSLLGIDGRVVAKTTMLSVECGNNQIVWHPQGISSSGGLYLVQVKTAGIFETQKVMFTK